MGAKSLASRAPMPDLNSVLPVRYLPGFLSACRIGVNIQETKTCAVLTEITWEETVSWAHFLDQRGC